MNSFIEKRVIELPRGGELEVEMTQAFLDKIVIYFNLDSQADLSDDHIRMFVYGSLNSATNKAEEELKGL